MKSLKVRMRIFHPRSSWDKLLIWIQNDEYILAVKRYMRGEARHSFEFF